MQRIFFQKVQGLFSKRPSVVLFSEVITSRKRPLNLGIRWVVALRRCDCKNKLTVKIAFSEHLLVISRFFLPRRGLFASLGSLEEGKGKFTGNNGTRRKKEGNCAFLSSRRPTRVNYS